MSITYWGSSGFPTLQRAKAQGTLESSSKVPPSRIKYTLHNQLQVHIRRSTYVEVWLADSCQFCMHDYIHTQRSGDFIACCSCCFLCISLIAFLVRDICEGAPTNPDSLCLQLEHVVAHLWWGNGKMGWGWAWQNSICVAQGGSSPRYAHSKGWDTYVQPTLLGSQRRPAASSDGSPSWTPRPVSSFAVHTHIMLFEYLHCDSIISQWVRPKTARRGHFFVLNLKRSEDAYKQILGDFCQLARAAKLPFIETSYWGRWRTNLETRRLAGFIHTYIHMSWQTVPQLLGFQRRRVGLHATYPTYIHTHIHNSLETDQGW